MIRSRESGKRKTNQGSTNQVKIGTNQANEVRIRRFIANQGNFIKSGMCAFSRREKLHILYQIRDISANQECVLFHDVRNMSCSIKSGKYSANQECLLFHDVRNSTFSTNQECVLFHEREIPPIFSKSRLWIQINVM